MSFCNVTISCLFIKFGIRAYEIAKMKFVSVNRVFL